MMVESDGIAPRTGEAERLARTCCIRHRQPFLVQGLRQRTRLSRARYRGAGGKARASEALDDSVRSCEVARPIRVSVTRREMRPVRRAGCVPRRRRAHTDGVGRRLHRGCSHTCSRA